MYDPFSSGVDALAQTDWSFENNYVNAPFRLIPRVLDIIQDQEAYATIIAPYWEAQPWFNRLQIMLIDTPFHFPNNSKTMWSMEIIPEPMKNKNWKIYAWKVHGKSFDK